MLPPLPLPTSLAATVVLVASACACAVLWFRDLLRRRVVRLVASAVVAALLLAHAAWGIGPLVDHYPTSYWGAAIASAGLVVFAFFVVSLPLAALARAVLSRIVLAGRRPARVGPRGAADGGRADDGAGAVGRRAFVAGATALVPLGAVTVAGRGFMAAADDDVAERVVRFELERLPAALDGFTIVQLTDLHLGLGRTLDDLERMLLALERRGRPDLVVVTGDLADDVRLVPAALRLLAGVRAPCGVLACLGNHEHLHDVRLARRAFDASDARLLVDDSTTIVSRSGGRILVTGVDDPVVVHTDVRPWLADRLGDALRRERARRSGTAADLHLLLAHRPEAIEPAAARGIDLVLSGHTHGGQIGFNGKSAFEPLYPDGYLWGPYRRGPTQLYTSAGAGQWFPFRLGCRAELPRIELSTGARGGGSVVG